MILKIKETTVDFDYDLTLNYYRTHDVCTCCDCQNYQKSAKNRFPQLDGFLLQFGVDISRPDEISSVYHQETGEIQYFFIAYTVAGRILTDGESCITLNDFDQSVNVTVSNEYFPNQQQGDYFSIVVTDIVIPWLLGAEYPDNAGDTLLEENVETKFECIYTMTEQINDEALKYLMFRRWNAVFSYVCGGLFFLFGVGLGVWSYTVTGSVPRQVWLMVFLALLLPLTQVLMYVVVRRQRSAQWKELTGDKPVTVTVRVTDTGLEYLSSARTEPTVLRFDEFSRVVETKNLLGLMSRSKMMYAMAKDGFTVGTAEECRAFLRGKGIK